LIIFKNEFFFVFEKLVQLTCNDIDRIRSKRLLEVFSQTLPKTILNKHVKFVKGDGCLFGKHEPASYDRV